MMCSSNQKSKQVPVTWSDYVVVFIITITRNDVLQQSEEQACSFNLVSLACVVVFITIERKDQLEQLQ
jgi:hypothetical protein